MLSIDGQNGWVQGKGMHGHRQTDTSDTYALAEPAQLGRALTVTNGIIEEI